MKQRQIAYELEGEHLLSYVVSWYNELEGSIIEAGYFKEKFLILKTVDLKIFQCHPFESTYLYQAVVLLLVEELVEEN